MRKLGRGLSELGLSELLSGAGHSAALQSPSSEQNQLGKLHTLSVDCIFPSEYQPRKQFDQLALSELADSIRAQGVLQPIIVRKKSDTRYEIIAGERRWRAAQMAGIETIPAIIRDISGQTAVAFALIENIQRQDLNSMEEAQGLQRLLNEFNLTHEAVAQAVGKSRAAVSNLLRLLQLNPDVKILLSEGRLEKGHALVLLALEGSTQSELAREIVEKSLSVRETEIRVHQKRAPETAKKSGEKNIVAVECQRNLSEKLGTKVMIRHNVKGKGKITVHYHDLDELAGILERIQ